MRAMNGLNHLQMKNELIISESEKVAKKKSAIEGTTAINYI